MSQPSFRTKAAAITAILQQRDRIKDCMKEGVDNDLMRHLGMRDQKAYKMFHAARSSDRMDEASKDDFVGFVPVACRSGELSNLELVGMCENELDKTEKFQITAQDLAEAYNKQVDDDCLMSCPVLAPPGSTAAQVMAEFQDDELQELNTHEEVIGALASASENAAKATDKQLQDLLISEKPITEAPSTQKEEATPATEKEAETTAPSQASFEARSDSEESDTCIVNAVEAPKLSQSALDAALSRAEEEVEAASHSKGKKGRNKDQADITADYIEEGKGKKKKTPLVTKDKDKEEGENDAYAELDEHARQDGYDEWESKAKMSKADAKAAKKSAAKAAKKANAKLQNLLDKEEQRLGIHEASKAYHSSKEFPVFQNKKSGKKMDSITPELEKLHPELIETLRAMKAEQQLHRENVKDMVNNHEQMISNYKREMKESQKALASATQMHSKQMKQAQDNFEKHQKVTAGIIQQHQNFSTDMQQRVHSTVNAVNAFFSKALGEKAPPKALQAFQSGKQLALESKSTPPVTSKKTKKKPTKL